MWPFVQRMIRFQLALQPSGTDFSGGTTLTLELEIFNCCCDINMKHCHLSRCKAPGFVFALFFSPHHFLLTAFSCTSSFFWTAKASLTSSSLSHFHPCNSKCPCVYIVLYVCVLLCLLLRVPSDSLHRYVFVHYFFFQLLLHPPLACLMSSCSVSQLSIWHSGFHKHSIFKG